jgi:CHAT domain-containing protein
VAALCGRRGHVTCLTGAAASEAAFKQQAPGKRVLHFATHAFFLNGPLDAAGSHERGFVLTDMSSEHPDTGEPSALGGLALAGANRPHALDDNAEDGILTAEEIASVDLQGVEMAVLSGCDTGVGEIQIGEGVFGLRRAFQVAGVRTVIMSLWPVQDEVARSWMKSLYEARWAEGMSTIAAVRYANLRALRASRALRGTAHPYYWASFVAVGDWD